VCHDAVLFSGRSEKGLKDAMAVAIRDDVRRQAQAMPALEYVVIATHWQHGKRSGHAFRNAATRLQGMTTATVVTALSGPGGELETLAERFVTSGPGSTRTATLIVRPAR